MYHLSGYHCVVYGNCYKSDSAASDIFYHRELREGTEATEPVLVNINFYQGVPRLIETGAALSVHTAQALSARPVSTAIANAKYYTQI